MISFPLDSIRPALAEAGLALDAVASERLQVYGNLLLEWNQKMNLTAITDPHDIVNKHFLDSLLLLKHHSPSQNSSVIDVGTGAGFPGMVLLIARPDLRLTLLDSLQKRIGFLNALADALGLSLITLHARAEEAGRDSALRETFDLATARAVAKLPVLCEYCLPFVKPGGLFIAMKGPEISDEMHSAASAAQMLGAGALHCQADQLPGGEKRNFVICKKISQTPSKFPRNPSKIAKQPL